MKAKQIILSVICTIVLGSASAQDKLLFPIEVNGKVGYIDTNGMVIISPRFDFGRYFIHTNSTVVRIDGEERLIDTLGNYLTESYDEMGFFPSPIVPNSPRLINVKKGLKWGFLDASGNEAIPFIYEEAEAFIGGYARVQKAGKLGYISLEGDFYSIGSFDKLENIGHGLFKITNKEKMGIYSAIEGEIILEPSDYHVDEVSEEEIIIYDVSMHNCILLNHKGDRILEPSRSLYLTFGNPDCNLLVAYSASSEKYGVITFNGEWIKKPKFKYESLSGYEKSGNDCFATFKVKTKTGETLKGTLNSTGEVAIAPIYSDLYNVDGYYFFKRQGKETEGIMDCNENVIIPDQYNEINIVHGEFAEIVIGEYLSDDAKTGYLNIQTNAVIWKPSN